MTGAAPQSAEPLCSVSVPLESGCQPERSLRIVVHDYAGYPFAVELSRWLARQGHAVLHIYSKDVEAPHGRLRLQGNDPPTLLVEGVSTGRPLPKYKLIQRWFQELRYGAVIGRRITVFRPDIVLSANAPPAVQSQLLKATQRAGVPLLCWVQDIFSLGVEEISKSRLAPLRWAVLRFVEAVEFGAMRRSAGLVMISSDFRKVLAEKGVRHNRSIVIENWAPLDDISPQPKDNPWSRAHGLADKFVFLCAGTLGLKHNPAHIVNLARAFADDPKVRVVVVSQGPGRTYLEGVKKQESLDALVLLDYQPFEQLSQVLSTADVSVLLLETYAGQLSVPSKVYSYLCVGRPIVGALPASNLACRIVAREKAGLTVAPDDQEGFVTAARRLRADPALCANLAKHQRDYARRTFDIERIGADFMAVIKAISRESANWDGASGQDVARVP